MLVISRKVGDRIQIGEEITVVVTRIAGHRVTLGLQAPRDVRIIRGELTPFDEPAGPGANRQAAAAVGGGEPHVEFELDLNPGPIPSQRPR